jgi:uncharacterized damage-inducible protein DinB
MGKQDMLLSLYDYATWANDKVLAQVAELSDDAYRRPMAAQTRSVHDTLVHLVSAEWRWYEAWRGGAFVPADLNAEALDTLAALRSRWADLAELRHAHLGSLSEADLDEQLQRTRGWRTLSFIRWQAMATVVLHGVQHRAEIAEYLTAAGRSPGDLDFILYVASRPSAA